MDKTIINKTKLKNRRSDFEYWQTQPISSRLATLQKISEEYIGWKWVHDNFV